MADWRISVDIGGTFTDLVALNESTLELVNVKIPSTPTSPSRAVVDVLRRFLEGKDNKVKLMIHASTIAANALLGQMGLEVPRTGLITTKGFRDVIEIGRQQRAEVYNVFFQRPRPLVRRKYRFEVDERVTASGEVLRPLRREEFMKVMRKVKAEGIKSIAICFLNSYINPKNEVEARNIIRSNFPFISVSISTEVSPEYREYERTSTTVVNAVLKPIVSKYILNLIHELRSIEANFPVYIMQSNGGVATAKSVIDKPITMIESGPAAGVIASAYYAKLLKLNNVLSFDMGGTTAKAGSVTDGVPETTDEYEVGGRIHRGRVVKGSGYPVRQQFIDLAECSAGGGTIAWVDKGGGLRVGPISAGSDPGPACYGLGGEDPTVTDANLVLGRLNQKYLLGGDMKIHLELARRSFREKVCELTGLDVEEAAAGVVRIINSDMSKILRIVSIERGYDPRNFNLIAFGGAGPMHACALAEGLGVSRIIVPVNPGMFSALGLLVSDFIHIYSRPLMKDASKVEPSEVENMFNHLEEEGRKKLEEEGVDPNQMLFIREIDARYYRQSYELAVPAGKPFNEESIKEVLKSFDERHRKIYGFSDEGEKVVFVNLKVKAKGLVRKPALKRYSYVDEKPVDGSILERRPVYFEEIDSFVKSPVYLRSRLKPGNRIDGPAIIEQYDSTTVIYPNWRAYIDEFRNIVLEAYV